MIKFHGGVWGDRYGYADHADIIGRNFCVSYASVKPQVKVVNGVVRPDPMTQLFHEIGQSVLLDNGAFTFYKQGTATDWPGFYKWAEKWLEFPTTRAIIPDVMGGNEKDNDKLVEEWPFGQRGTPVWHPNESLERLERFRDEWDLVCIGGAADYEPVNGPKWKDRIADAMDVLCDKDGLPRCKIHMLRGLRFVAGPYPLYSADSVSVVRGRGGMPKNGTPPKEVRKMLDAIDARNPPARWVRRDHELLEVGSVVGSFKEWKGTKPEQLKEVEQVEDPNDLDVELVQGVGWDAVKMEFPEAHVDKVIETSTEYAQKPRKQRGGKEGENMALFNVDDDKVQEAT